MFGFLSPLQESATTRLVIGAGGLPGGMDGSSSGTALPADLALTRLREWVRRSDLAAARHMLFEADMLATGRAPVGPLRSDRLLWDRIERAFRERRLVLYESIQSLPAPKNVPTPEAPPAPPEPPPKKLDWVEIVLLDEEGVPVADEKYSVQLPDGSTREGTLDANGTARIEEFEAGTCFVTFPEIKVRPRAGDAA